MQQDLDTKQDMWVQRRTPIRLLNRRRSTSHQVNLICPRLSLFGLSASHFTAISLAAATHPEIGSPVVGRVLDCMSLLARPLHPSDS
jgi:hypothetical protein